jgi:hypothetical protein
MQINENVNPNILPFLNFNIVQIIIIAAEENRIMGYSNTELKIRGATIDINMPPVAPPMTLNR